MNVIQISPGAREVARSYPGATSPRSNASHAVSNGLKRTRKAAKPARAGLSRDKIALIHVARRELRLDEDLYRAILRDVAGVASSKDLTEAGFLALMARFERSGFKGQPGAAPAKPEPLSERFGMATAAQLAYIRGLWAQWLGRPDEAALTRWVENKYHVSAIRFMDVVRAQKAIEGLKRMVARQREVRDEQEADQ